VREWPFGEISGWIAFIYAISYVLFHHIILQWLAQGAIPAVPILSQLFMENRKQQISCQQPALLICADSRRAVTVQRCKSALTADKLSATSPINLR